MEQTPRQIFDDDPTNASEELSDTIIAFQCGLQGLDFLGIWTASAFLAYTRGRSARSGYPIIDEPNTPEFTNLTIDQT